MKGVVATLACRLRARFSRVLRAPFQPDRNGQPLHHLEIGAFGERIACAYLRVKGRKVLYRNFRAPRGGEIDVVARDGEVLTFVEVKTRTSEEFGRPLEAVGTKKHKLMQRGANEWLRLLGTRDVAWRFDVVEVLLSEGEKPQVNVVLNVTG